MTSASSILLTGFPSSFLARRLLAKMLVKLPEAHLMCLVSDNFMKQAQDLRRVLPKAERRRVELVPGDVSAMDFGMTGKEFLQLAGKTDAIHHCPTATRPGVERQVAERVNIGGAGEILELAEASDTIQRVVHWSSASVSGKRQGHVLESELAKPPAFRSVVEETLFRAERVMREAMDHLPITVLRPSIIVGDSRTGEIDRLEGPYLLILLMLSAPVDLRVPLPGRGDTGLNLVPIDFVVDAGLTLALDPRSVGRTFHLVDDQPPTARRVFELIAEEAGRPGPVGSLPTQIATALLRTPGLERFSHIPRTFLEQLSTDVVYDDRNTQELLAGTGIVCPPAASYLKVMVDHVRREQRARAEARKQPEPIERPSEEADDPLA
ncbi:MAG: SDR family oxidoreductase [Myxococcales bacterium]|nr:SDR family oxidoreductase [Myxococcales bacterium]MDD9971638.1 SDR family oxidoreductase [Myxococcales bacterium]